MAFRDPRTIDVNLPRFDPRLLRAIAIALIAFWLVLSSYYTVLPEEVGVILRFGKFNSIREPGLHFKLPFGIDDVSKVKVKRLLKLEFGFGTPGATNLEQISSD